MFWLYSVVGTCFLLYFFEVCRLEQTYSDSLYHFVTWVQMLHLMHCNLVKWNALDWYAFSLYQAHSPKRLIIWINKTLILHIKHFRWVFFFFFHFSQNFCGWRIIFLKVFSSHLKGFCISKRWWEAPGGVVTLEVVLRHVHNASC